MTAAAPLAYCWSCRILGLAGAFAGHMGLAVILLLLLGQQPAAPLPPPVEATTIALHVVAPQKSMPQPPPVKPEPLPIPAPAKSTPVVQPQQHKPRPAPSQAQRAAPRQPAPPAQEPAPQQAKAAQQQQAAAVTETQAKQTLLSYLLAQIEKYKHYPDIARRRGIEGVVRIAVSIDASGNLISIGIHGDSAPPLLAKATQSVVNKIQGNWKSPGNGVPVSVVVPLRYSLQDAR